MSVKTQPYYPLMFANVLTINISPLRNIFLSKCVCINASRMYKTKYEYKSWRLHHCSENVTDLLACALTFLQFISCPPFSVLVR